MINANFLKLFKIKNRNTSFLECIARFGPEWLFGLYELSTKDKKAKLLIMVIHG